MVGPYQGCKRIEQPLRSRRGIGMAWCVLVLKPLEEHTALRWGKGRRVMSSYYSRRAKDARLVSFPKSYLYSYFFFTEEYLKRYHVHIFFYREQDLIPQLTNGVENLRKMIALFEFMTEMMIEYCYRIIMWKVTLSTPYHLMACTGESMCIGGIYVNVNWKWSKKWRKWENNFLAVTSSNTCFRCMAVSHLLGSCY